MSHQMLSLLVFAEHIPTNMHQFLIRGFRFLHGLTNTRTDAAENSYSTAQLVYT